MEACYKDLAGKIGLGQSDRVAGLWEMLCDVTDAEILLSLPAQAGAVAEKLGLTEDEVQRRLDGQFIKGTVFPSSKTTPPTYRMSRDPVQFHDATILWPGAPESFLDLWRDFMNEEWPDFAAMVSQALPKPYTRIIPVGRSLEARQKILDFESVRDIVKNADNLAVTGCTCRMTMKNCDLPVERCMQVNRAADYALARGTGRRLTKDEALDMLRACEEEGLIHVTFNTPDVNHFICNCCPCCCQTMPVLIERGVHIIDPSRYTARIDAEACSGCGECHERCYFGAISWEEDEGSASVVDAEKCMGCGLCTVTCPEEAIVMEEVRPIEFVPGATQSVA